MTTNKVRTNIYINKEIKIETQKVIKEARENKNMTKTSLEELKSITNA